MTPLINFVLKTCQNQCVGIAKHCWSLVIGKSQIVLPHGNLSDKIEMVCNKLTILSDIMPSANLHFRPLPAHFWPIRSSLPWSVWGYNVYLAHHHSCMKCNTNREGGDIFLVVHLQSKLKSHLKNSSFNRNISVILVLFHLKSLGPVVYNKHSNCTMWANIKIVGFIRNVLKL